MAREKLIRFSSVKTAGSISARESFLELEEGRLCMECAYAMSREELLEMAGIEILEAGRERA